MLVLFVGTLVKHSRKSGEAPVLVLDMGWAARERRKKGRKLKKKKKKNRRLEPSETLLNQQHGNPSFSEIRNLNQIIRSEVGFNN